MVFFVLWWGKVFFLRQDSFYFKQFNVLKIVFSYAASVLNQSKWNLQSSLEKELPSGIKRGFIHFSYVSQIHFVSLEIWQSIIQNSSSSPSTGLSNQIRRGNTPVALQNSLQHSLGTSPCMCATSSSQQCRAVTYNCVHKNYNNSSQISRSRNLQFGKGSCGVLILLMFP